jgi:hypothetical protein
MPPLQWVQLLRILSQSSLEATNPDISSARHPLAGMRTADGEFNLAGIPGLAGSNSGRDSNRLSMMVGVSQADEQAPPIVSTCNYCSKQPATCHTNFSHAAPDQKCSLHPPVLSQRLSWHLCAFRALRSPRYRPALDGD